MSKIKVVFKRPASLLLILGLLQFGASIYFCLHGSWKETVGFAFTTAGTLIGWYLKIRQPLVISEGRDVSVNFFIKPGAKVILSSKEYQSLVPAICKNIGVTCNAMGDGLYNLVHNGERYYFSIKSDQIVDTADNSDNQEIEYPANNSDSAPLNYEILKCAIFYPPPRRIEMDGSNFVKKLQGFVNLVEKLSTQVRMNPKFSNVNVTGVITVWQYIAPDGVYKIQFLRKLNNLFKAQFLHTIKLSSEEEECTFGKTYTKFAIPLGNFPGILSNIVDIVWYT